MDEVVLGLTLCGIILLSTRMRLCALAVALVGLLYLVIVTARSRLDDRRLPPRRARRSWRVRTPRRMPTTEPFDELTPNPPATEAAATPPPPEKKKPLPPPAETDKPPPPAPEGEEEEEEDQEPPVVAAAVVVANNETGEFEAEHAVIGLPRYLRAAGAPMVVSPDDQRPLQRENISTTSPPSPNSTGERTLMASK